MPDTLYLGGGTPSLFASDDLAVIIATCRRSYPLEEITIEVNPATVDRESLCAYREMGINRLSIGVQSLDDRVLKRLGRQHTASQALQTVEVAREIFPDYSVDLIFAVPGFSKRCFVSTVETLIESYRPSHISAYSLSIEEGTLFHQQGLQIVEGQFCREYSWLHSYMRDHGYHHYEVSNFALPGRESQHNSKYWQRTPYLGLGPTAHSLWNDKRFCYGPSEDFARSSLVEKFCQAPQLSPTEIQEEKLLLGLRTSQGIDLDSLTISRQKLAGLAKASLLEIDNNRAVATLKGWMVLNCLILKMI